MIIYTMIIKNGHAVCGCNSQEDCNQAEADAAKARRELRQLQERFSKSEQEWKSSQNDILG